MDVQPGCGHGEGDARCPHFVPTGHVGAALSRDRGFLSSKRVKQRFVDVAPSGCGGTSPGFWREAVGAQQGGELQPDAGQLFNLKHGVHQLGADNGLLGGAQLAAQNAQVKVPAIVRGHGPRLAQQVGQEAKGGSTSGLAMPKLKQQPVCLRLL
eukprot:1542780-Prymnesium_polylepis.2